MQILQLGIEPTLDSVPVLYQLDLNDLQGPSGVWLVVTVLSLQMVLQESPEGMTAGWKG